MKEMIEFLENLPEGKWETKVNKDWNIKDVIAHLIAWNYESIRVIPSAWKTRKNPWIGIDNYDDFNKIATDRYKDFSSKGLLEELKKSEQLMDELLSHYALKEMKKRSEFNWLFEEGDEIHSIQHLNQIKKILKK